MRFVRETTRIERKGKSCARRVKDGGSQLTRPPSPGQKDETFPIVLRPHLDSPCSLTPCARYPATTLRLYLIACNCSFLTVPEQQTTRAITRSVPGPVGVVVRMRDRKVKADQTSR